MGKIAYEAFHGHQAVKSTVQNTGVLPFEHLPATEQEKWNAAATAVLDTVAAFRDCYE